jgi:uncharacterized membrane-anchored protein YhcB (DUF1043 family)
MRYILIIMVGLVIILIYLNRENKQLRKQSNAELRYEIARHQLDEWNTKYGKAE